MRTTVRINDDILHRAKIFAADRGKTLTSVIEEGLLLILSSKHDRTRKRVVLPVSKAAGGLQPGVDLNCSAALEDIMNRP